MLLPFRPQVAFLRGQRISTAYQDPGPKKTIRPLSKRILWVWVSAVLWVDSQVGAVGVVDVVGCWAGLWVLGVLLCFAILTFLGAVTAKLNTTKPATATTKYTIQRHLDFNESAALA